MQRLTALSLTCIALLASCASSPSGALPGAGELEPVAEFDANRYMGLWYEIAKYPVRFEKGLVAITAEYSLREDGDIQVINTGRKGTLDGPLSQAGAKAWAPDPDDPARLKVQFFWPFRADYWVLALDPEYRWAVVGEPKRRYLWILSRTPTIAPETRALIETEITSLGYDVSRLEDVLQVRPNDGSERQR